MNSSSENDEVIDLLRSENKRLQDKIRRLQNEVKNLREEIAVLTDKLELSHEDVLRLKIMDRAPFTMWACDRDCKIVLWTHQCESIYGYKKREAIGADFVELFVDEPEKKAAREDCVDIIDNDVVFRNFIAQDIAKDGSYRYMLTNCFRIWDSELNEWLQAEVALEIRDIHEAIKEHRNLREAGIWLAAQRKRMLEIEKKDLESRARIVYLEREMKIREKEREIRRYISRLRKEGQEQLADSLELSTTEQFSSDSQKLKNAFEVLLKSIKSCQSLQECEKLQEEVIQFEKESALRGDL